MQRTGEHTAFVEQGAYNCSLWMEGAACVERFA